MAEPLASEIDEVSLAALLGRFTSMQRDLNALHELAQAGRMTLPAGLAQNRVKIAATIDVLCGELHQLVHDPAQLPLFPEATYATF